MRTRQQTNRSVVTFLRSVDRVSTPLGSSSSSSWVWTRPDSQTVVDSKASSTSWTLVRLDPGAPNQYCVMYSLRVNWKFKTWSVEFCLHHFVHPQYGIQKWDISQPYLCTCVCHIGHEGSKQMRYHLYLNVAEGKDSTLQPCYEMMMEKMSKQKWKLSLHESPLSLSLVILLYRYTFCG